MNAIELLQFSLENALGILGQVTADLTQEQADWQPPGTANPIGATYWHTLSGIDDVVHKWCQQRAPLRETTDWQEKALTTSVPEPEPGGDMRTYMQTIRVDLPTLHEYAQTINGVAQEWLGSLTPADLDAKIELPFGEYNLGQVLDLFVVWHINAHCGEIAALKGCQGAKGYPF